MGDEVKPAHPRAAELLRLWLLLVASYVCVKLAYDLIIMGYLDVRPRSLAELVVLPTAQTAVFWWVTRRLRQSGGNLR